VRAGWKLGVFEMNTAWISHSEFVTAEQADPAVIADILLSGLLSAAAEGDADACFDMGVAYSTGNHGGGCDLVEAHKWFNLAAVSGHCEAARCRADISDEMSAREIAEAQRRAREWLAATRSKAA